MSEHLIIRQEEAIGWISLNRPKAIHALNTAMCQGMTDALLGWLDDDSVEVVMIDHHDGRGFCAGGDIRMLAQSGKEDGKEAREFFFTEYRLNHLMHVYPKPIVAFMDGITMGGGVGISQPAKFRVATENTRFAMPETGIGLFPDVGGGWYLSRLQGRVGVFLALTGARMDGAECHALGLASHYLPSEKLEEAKERIIASPDRTAGILGELSVTPPEPRIMDNMDKINRLFKSDRLNDIISALEEDDSDWSAKELHSLSTKSPLSCTVALRQLREGSEMPDFASEMVQEYAIGARVVQTHDFIEGVRALIIDKDNMPKWSPDNADGVGRDMLDEIFAPMGEGEAWSPLPQTANIAASAD